MPIQSVSRAILALFATFALAACGINSVPTAEERAKEAWGNVEAAYQARANLIPNLTEVAAGAAENERGILTDVIEARSRATSINLDASDLRDADQLAEYAAVQGQLSQGLGRLLANVEAYPQLQSNQNFVMLQGQLEGIENKIRVAINDYNAAVRDYNTTIRTFPDTIGANIIHGAEPMEPYSAVSENADVAERIDLTDGN